MGTNQSKKKDATIAVTTAKSQAMAVCCAGIIINRKKGNNHTTTSTNARVPTAPSMAQWARSGVPFRTWAEEWVLAPEREVDFVLPIWVDAVSTGHSHGFRGADSHMYVSVSPTLGVVTHRWYTCTMIDCGPAVVGCLGGDMVLHSWSDPGSDAYYGGLRKYDAVDLRCMPEPPQVTPAPPPSDEGSSCCFLTAASDMSVICNRKWVVTFDWTTLCAWKVVDGHPLPSSTPTLSFFIFERYSSEKILFAPWCGDIVMLKSAHDITLVDLEESFRREELVLTLRTSSPSQFDNLLGLLWGPDGSMFTLHTTDALASCAAVDCATGESHLFSPNVSLVEVFGRDHTFTVVHPGAFQVHHTGNNLTVPSLNVPCTWAQHKSGLILSTTQKSRGNGKVHLSLHDGFTGTHIGDFNVPLPPNFLFHLRIKL